MPGRTRHLETLLARPIQAALDVGWQLRSGAGLPLVVTALAPSRV